MDKEEVETNAIDIDIIDTVDHSNVIVIPEGTERDDPEYLGDAIPVSEDSTLRTGNIIGQFFNLISQVRNKEYWKLNDKETKSLNKVCPNILPDVLSQHSKKIGCILNVLGIIIKRLKMEREDNESQRPVDDIIKDEKSNESEESPSLTGGRTS